MKSKENRIASMGLPVRKFVFLLVTLVLMAALSAVPASAQATTVTTTIPIQIDLATSVSCAAGGAGEVVLLTGTELAVFVTVVDDSGAFHTQVHFISQGISGEGQTTGDRYQWAGATSASFNGTVGFENTFINNYKIIGPGPGNNLLIHETFHATIQADGEATAYVYYYTTTCQ